METTLTKDDATRATLTIAVTPEELRPHIDAAYKAIAEQIQIPGFRKGKVPPPIIDQRVGRAEVLSQAVQSSLDDFYRQALAESGAKAIGRPSADIDAWPDAKDFTGDLVIKVEVDVRPDIEVPDLEAQRVEVEPPTVSDEDLEAELDQLRARFGTLVTVDRPATTGDFVQLDLTATVDGAEVDSASGISYEVGSGELLDGIDEAVESLTAGEETTFTSELVGGDHAGAQAEVAVTVVSVKERELPDADDDFAQLASPFDTIDELRNDLRETVAKQKVFGQLTEARKTLQDQLLDAVEIPIPASIVEDEVHRHLEGENRLEDDEHRAEVTEQTEQQLRYQILFDTIADEHEIQVQPQELSQYVAQQAGQYGIAPQEFLEILSQNGQLPALFADLRRSKAVSFALTKADVVDTDGHKVDLSQFLAPAPEAGEQDIAQAVANAGAQLDAERAAE